MVQRAYQLDFAPTFQYMSRIQRMRCDSLGFTSGLVNSEFADKDQEYFTNININVCM